MAHLPIQTAMGNKISLFVLHQYGLNRLLKVSRASNGLITGSYYSQGPLPRDRRDIKDIHFTYPLNGNYHQTVIFKDGRELRVFYDRAIEKQSDGSWKTIPREEVEEHYCFPIKKYKSPSIEEFHNNPNAREHIIAVGFDESTFRNKPSNRLKRPSIVVDIRERKGILFTANLMLMSEKWDFSIFDQKAKVLARFIDESCQPYIYMLLEETGRC